MPVKREPDAVARTQRLPGIRLTVPIRVSQLPEVGYVGVIDVLPIHQYARPESREIVVEPVCKHSVCVIHTVAVTVPDEFDAIGGALVRLKILTQIATHRRQAILHGPVGQILLQPGHVPSHVGHTLMDSKGLGDVDISLHVDIEGNRVGQKRLGRYQIDHEMISSADMPEIPPGLAGRSFYIRFEDRCFGVGIGASRHTGRQ